MCNQCGIGIPISQKKHSCPTTDKKTVENMLANIPSNLKGKLAHSLVKEMQLEQKEEEKQSTVVNLPPAEGGKPPPSPDRTGEIPI